MKNTWKFWRKTETPAVTPEEPDAMDAVEKIISNAEPGSYAYGIGTMTSMGRDVNVRQHEAYLTQIALNKAQYRALSEQKKYAAIQEKATISMNVATIVMAFATVVIAAATVEQCHVAAKDPNPSVQPAKQVPQSQLLHSEEIGPRANKAQISNP